MKNFLKGKKMMAAGLAAAFIALTGLTATEETAAMAVTREAETREKLRRLP